jgi:hypothetical protein
MVYLITLLLVGCIAAAGECKHVIVGVSYIFLLLLLFILKDGTVSGSSMTGFYI